MAGLFGFFDFTKPGKGVDPDAPQKKAFFRFFELYWRKFSRLMLLNLMFFVFVFPIITFLYVQYYNLLPESVVNDILSNEQTTDTLVSMLPGILFTIQGILPIPIYIALVGLSVIFYGPAMCGLTYMLRNYVREEHAWFSDFFTKMKENFLQGMIIGILEIGFSCLIVFNIFSQADSSASDGSLAMLQVVKLLSIILLVLISFMRNYYYTIIVTFRMKLWGIIKNSLIFAIMGLFRNALVVIIEIALIAIALIFNIVDVVIVLFFYFSLTGFLTIFTCYPLIHKHMIIPALPKDEPPDDPEDPVERVDPSLLGG